MKRTQLNRNIVFATLVLCAVFMFTNYSWALNLGTNFTIYDKDGYNGVGVGYEDQETEPGTINNQTWDLEAIFWDRATSTLSILGGFDFKNGNGGFASGDIFIDVTGDAEYGSLNNSSWPGVNAIVSDTYGYDYVIDLNQYTDPSKDDGLINNNFNVYDIQSEEVKTRGVTYNINDESNPWIYYSGGSSLGSDHAFVYGTVGDNDIDNYSFFGGTHYYLSFDLSHSDLAILLNQMTASGSSFTVKFTAECGNDNLVAYDPVPEPPAMLLLGAGIVGFVGLTRKRFIKK